MSIDTRPTAWCEVIGMIEWFNRECFMRYTVVLEKEADGGYVASGPALPGCVSQGDTRPEARRISVKRLSCTLKIAAMPAIRCRPRRARNLLRSKPPDGKDGDGQASYGSFGRDARAGDTKTDAQGRFHFNAVKGAPICEFFASPEARCASRSQRAADARRSGNVSHGGRCLRQRHGGRCRRQARAGSIAFAGIP